MFSRKESVCQQSLVPHEGGVAVWHRERVQSVAAMAHVIQTVTAALSHAGFPKKEIFRLHLALEEAIVNANKHGHQGDWSIPFSVRYHVNENGLVVEIEDQGLGFDPDQVPDPLAPENLERPSGRGLMLMRTYILPFAKLFVSLRNAAAIVN